ncbi:MAG TPA: UbiA family prenyltransferase [Candidatus Aenigmarchaeota archaeon]|nr:UbiA family prenyltransferase [Candidatus Aenigmarchaeota archaeon]
MTTYLKLMRPLNGIMSVIAVWIGTLIAGAALVPDNGIFFGMVAVFLISGGGMAINDFFDVEIDKLNKPNRPLASGKISKRAALVFSGVLFIVGNAAAYMINAEAFFTAVIVSALLIAYAAHLKKTILIGNLIISGLVGLTFVFGGIIIGDYTPVLPLALLAFLSNTAREIYKTIDDALGDRIYNVNSLAIKLGVVKTRIIGNTFLIVAVAFSFVPYILGMLGIMYLFFVLFADIVFLSAIVAPAKYGSKLIKIAMFIALIAFITGVVRL